MSGIKRLTFVVHAELNLEMQPVIYCVAAHALEADSKALDEAQIPINRGIDAVCWPVSKTDFVRAVLEKGVQELEHLASRVIALKAYS